MFSEYDVELLSAYQEKVEKHDFGKMCEDVRILQEACKKIAKNSLHISTYEDVKNDMLTSISINKELISPTRQMTVGIIPRIKNPQPIALKKFAGALIKFTR